MGKLTKKIPKPMLNVKGKPLIENEILRFRNFGFKKIYISVNYLSEKIMNYFKNGEEWKLNISYIKETKKLGTAGPLSLINKNDADYIDMLYRQKFNYVTKDEIIIKLKWV